jgi:hypothetical protein
VIKSVDIISEGTRLSGDLYLPDDLQAGEKHPTILLCHGWGGPKEHLNNTYAPVFHKAGFVCLTFDYRGWFTSDARLVSEEAQGEPDADGYLTMKVRPVRDIVDPFDQYQDIINCLDYLCGEEAVDIDRIGIWGSSFGCGHAIRVACNDARIKCVVAQVGTAFEGEFLAMPSAQQRAQEKARGEHGVLPALGDGRPGLAGVPDYAKMQHYTADTEKLMVPTLLMDQADEELFDRNGQMPVLYEKLKRRISAAYHTFPGPHYAIYDQNLKGSSQKARDWYLEHL